MHIIMILPLPFSPHPPKVKYEKWLFKICSERDGDAAILSKLKNRGVDFNEFDSVRTSIIIIISSHNNIVIECRNLIILF